MISPEKAAKRASRCVCKMCGTPIETKIVVYNKYGGSGVELYCPHCGCIEYGTEKEIYQIAKDFVDNLEFDYFTEMEEGQRRYELNISKICEVLSWIYRKNGILGKNGIGDEWKKLFEYDL